LRADAPGILVEGFEYVAALGMPYNYAYYPELMTAVGFEKEIDYLSGYMAEEHHLPDRVVRIVDKIKKRSDFWIKSFSSKRELRKWIPAIQRVNNEAFTDVWGYYPIDEAEGQMIGKQLLTVADPRLLKIVMKGEDIAGAPAEITPAAGDTFTISQKWLELDSTGEINQIVFEDGDTITFTESAFAWEQVYAPEGEYLVGFLVGDLDGNLKEAYTRVSVR